MQILRPSDAEEYRGLLGRNRQCVGEQVSNVGRLVQSMELSQPRLGRSRSTTRGLAPIRGTSTRLRLPGQGAGAAVRVDRARPAVPRVVASPRSPEWPDWRLATAHRNVRELYTALAGCYEDGDWIFLFGFSRGAFTVRVLAGLIFRCGLLPKETRRLE